MPPVKTPPMRESERKKLAKTRRGQTRKIAPGGKKVIVKPKGQSRRVKDPFGGGLPGAGGGRKILDRKVKPGKPERAKKAKPAPRPRPGTGAEDIMRRTPPPVQRALDRAVKGPDGRLYARDQKDLHALKQYDRDVTRAIKDLDRRERIRQREIAKFGKRKAELRDPIFTGPPATGDVILPHKRSRVSLPITSGKELNLASRPGSEFMRTATGVRTTYKGFGELKRRAMSPQERKEYDARNRAATIQAALVGVSLLPIGGPLVAAGARGAVRLGKIAKGLMPVAGQAGRQRVRVELARRGAQFKLGRAMVKGRKPIRSTAKTIRAERARRIGEATTRLGRIRRGTTARTIALPVRRPRAVLGGAAVSPIAAEPLAVTEGNRPSLQAALEGRGFLAANTFLGGGGKGVLGTAGNFGADLINLPAQMIPSIYIPVVAAWAKFHGDDARWKELIKQLKETDPAGALILAGDPAKAVKNLQEHPLFGLLEVAGGYGAAGRGAGFAARHSGIRALEEAGSRERAPTTFKGRDVVVERRFSPNIISKQVQKAADKRGMPPLRDSRVGRALKLPGTEELAVRRMERRSRNLVIRHVEDIIRAAKDFNIGKNQEAVAMTVQNILRPTSIDQMQADARFLTELWSKAREKYADNTGEADLIDANLDALARVAADPEFAGRVAQAAAAFKETQTPHEMALIEAEAIEAMRALRRSELPAAILYRDVRFVPEADRFEQFGGPDETPPAAPPETPPPGGGGPGPAGPTPDPRLGPPSLREKVEAALGPLAGAKQVNIMADLIRRTQQGRIPIDQRSAAIRRMREGHITTVHDPELERFWNEVDPNGEIRQYYLQQDSFRPERLSEPVDLDAAADALGKTDDEVDMDLRNYMKDEDGEQMSGGGLMDDPNEQNRILTQAEQAIDDADEFNIDTTYLENQIHEYEQGGGSLSNIKDEIADLYELIDDARPLSKDATAQYLSEVEQLPEAFRREPRPSPSAVERPAGMTHEEFMQHYESRKGFGSHPREEPSSDVRLPGDTLEESIKNVDQEGLQILINEMADPFNTQQGHSIIARLAEERNWSRATFRIAQSMINYHQWVKKLSPEQAKNFHRLETGEPVLGQADRKRLNDLIAELEFERSLPEDSQNPSYIGRLIRNISEAQRDPTLKQIEGLPEVNRDVLYKDLEEQIEVGRELMNDYRDRAMKDPHSPVGTAWRALHNATLRAERNLSDTDLGPSVLADLTEQARKLEDEVATSNELGDFGMTPDIDDGDPQSMTEIQLRDGIDEIRAELANNKVRGEADEGTIQLKENLAELEREYARRVSMTPSDERAANLRTPEAISRQMDALTEALDERGHNELRERLTDALADYMRGRIGPDELRLLAGQIEGSSIRLLQRQEPPQTPPPGAGGPPAPPTGGGKGGGEPPAGGGRIGPLYEGGGEGRPINTAEMIRQREAAGEPRPGFLSGRMTGVSAAAEAGKPFVSGKVKGGRATGETWLEGLQAGDITSMVQTIMGQRGYAERINLHRTLGEQMGHRDENGNLLTVADAEKFARTRTQLIERGLLDPNEDYVLIKALAEKTVPPESMAELRKAIENDTATPDDVLHMLEKQADEGDPDVFDLGTYLELDALDEFLASSRGNAPQGYWILTKRAADQYKNLMSARLMDPATRFMRGWQAAFKSAVLPTSTKWIAGNFFDVSMRALLAGIAPPGLVHLDPRYQFMKELRKVMEDIDKEASNAWFASLGLRGHYGSQGVVPRITGREGLKFRQNMKGLIDALAHARVKPTARNMVDLYSRYRDTVYHFNTKLIEETPQFAFLGKLAKQELKQRMKHWDMTSKSYEDALRDFAKGLLATRKQEYFAERLARQFGDWSTLGPTERRFLVNYVPFYLWARAATKFVLVTLPRDHPIFTALAATANSMTQEERRAFGFDLLYKKGAGVLPRFLQGGVPVGKKDSKYGIKGLAYATTFGVWADYPNALASFILPQANSALWAGSGLDFTGEHITNADGTPITAAQKAGLVAYFIAEPLIPFSAMGRTMLRGDREHRGWFPLTGFKGQRAPFGTTAGHALVPSPLPGSKTYPKGLTDYLRWRQTHAQQIWVPIKGGVQAPGRGEKKKFGEAPRREFGAPRSGGGLR